MHQCEVRKPKEPPKKDLVFIPPLHTRPQDAVGDYAVSKLFREVPRIKPAWDCARGGPELGLLTSKRELDKAKMELKQKRVYQNEKRKEMDELWNDLKNKEDALRESFGVYDKFVKENYEKRERAKEKIKEEGELQQKRLIELEEIKEKTNELMLMKKAMEEHVQKLKIYQDFMERVVAECEDFNTVHDILDRYATLYYTRMELARRQDSDLQDLERARRELMLILEAKSKALMGYNNHLSDLWIRYEKARLEDLNWEAVVIAMQDKAIEKIREWGSMRLLCWRLYKLICHVRNEQPTLAPDQAEEQLVFIQHNFLQLKAIVKMARKNMVSEAVKPVNTMDTQPRTIILTEGT